MSCEVRDTIWSYSLSTFLKETCRVVRSRWLRWRKTPPTLLYWLARYCGWEFFTRDVLLKEWLLTLQAQPSTPKLSDNLGLIFT